MCVYKIFQDRSCSNFIGDRIQMQRRLAISALGTTTSTKARKIFGSIIQQLIKPFLFYFLFCICDLRNIKFNEYFEQCHIQIPRVGGEAKCDGIHRH